MIRLDWHANIVPENFRTTVFYLISRLVFWRYPTLDFTVGHFATRIGAKFYTSYRYDWPDEIRARGLMVVDVDVPIIKPSVIHFHSPKRDITDDAGEQNGIIWKYFTDHGPNVYFDASVPSETITTFIETNFDLDRRTQGL